LKEKVKYIEDLLTGEIGSELSKLITKIGWKSKEYGWSGYL